MSNSSMTERGQFSEQVLAELNKEPIPGDVKSREVWFGRKKETAYYLDGNVVFRELNRIFGLDHSNTSDVRPLLSLIQVGYELGARDRCAATSLHSSMFLLDSLEPI